MQSYCKSHIEYLARLRGVIPPWRNHSTGYTRRPSAGPSKPLKHGVREPSFSADAAHKVCAKLHTSLRLRGEPSVNPKASSRN
jgi:hypothetical protein